MFRPTPMSPRPVIGRVCFHFSLTPDPRKSKNASTTSPAHVNRSATKGSGGTSPTAYFAAYRVGPESNGCREQLSLGEQRRSLATVHKGGFYARSTTDTQGPAAQTGLTQYSPIVTLAFLLRWLRGDEEPGKARIRKGEVVVRKRRFGGCDREKVHPARVSLLVVGVRLRWYLYRRHRGWLQVAT